SARERQTEGKLLKNKGFFHGKCQHRQIVDTIGVSPHSSCMPRRLPKYVQAFVDRRNDQPRHYFRRKGYPLTALPGLPYTPEFMSAYGNALASSEELIKKAKGERPARSVQPVAKVAPGSMAALIRDFKAARFPELGDVTRENYTRLLNRLERAAGPLPVAKITE